MALTSMDRALFTIRRGWNQTVGRYFRYDTYGIRLFGIQMTPKRVADILKGGNGGRFSEHQLRYFQIYLVFNSFYVFIPRFFSRDES